jgi:hypothetical protein
MLLEDYLEKYVFANATKETIMAKEKDIEWFNKFFKTYHAGLDIERKAIEIL